MDGLLERGRELAELDELLAAAREGSGALALVVGEAGIGKSSLLSEWLATVADAAIHVGWCDDLVSGRTLGPLRDVARSARGALEDAVRAGDVGRVFDEVLELLNNPLRPTVLVLEDLHWVDEATLDVVRYVGRRIAGLPAVLIVTYREEEVGPRHRLHRVMAALGTTPMRRLQLQPLSQEAVAVLSAPRGLDAAAIMEVTGGNPFFVSQTLDAPAQDVPATVIESVLVRLYALGADTRVAVERLSVVPGHAGTQLVEALTGGDPAVLAPAERRGLLAASEGGAARFRHELTRRAVLESMTSVDRVAAHRAVLDALVAEGTRDHARLLHHAVGAGDDELVVQHGVGAADEAFRAGAFGAAAAAHAQVLARAHLLDDAEHARLLTQDAWTLHNLQRVAMSVERAEEGVARSRELADPALTTRALRVLARNRYVAQDAPGALAAAEAAVEAATDGGDRELLAEAEVARLGMWALLDRAGEAADAGPRLLEEARALGRTDLESLVRNYGTVADVILGRSDRPAAETRLEEAISIARQGRHLEAAARAYTNIVGAMLLWRDHHGAMRWLEEGLEYTADHDVAYFRFTMLAHRAMRRVDVGRWTEAAADLRALLEEPAATGVLANNLTRGLARIAVRRGDADADALLETAAARADATGTTQYVAPVAVLRTEHEFLSGRVKGTAAAAATVLRLHGAGSWAHGEALAWCRRAGATLPAGWQDLEVHEEWSHVLHGRWQEAADLAAAEGRVYDEALARLDSGAVDVMLEALRTLDELGATPAARIARRRLKDAGVSTVPRGPNRSTRKDPAGLTTRQLDVLELLMDGLSNPDIAERLVLSPRTVDRHVSAVLTKLGVASRHEAPAAHAALLEREDRAD